MKHHLILIAAALAIASPGYATDLYWSGDGANEGGPGTWDTVNPRFGTSAGGPFNTIWDNTAANNVTFEGGFGTVTVSSITNNGTLTDNSGYTFSSSTLTLGPSAAFTIASGATTTLSSVLAGAGGVLTKNGAGVLVINNNNSYTGGTILNEGTLAFGSAGTITFGLNTPANKFTINADNVVIANTTTSGRTPQASVDQLGDLIVDNSLSASVGQVTFSLAQGPWTVKGGNRRITVNGTVTPTILAIGPAAIGVQILEDGTPRSLTKDGTGRLVIQAENLITGGFIISGGEVRIGGTVVSPFGNTSLSTLTLAGGTLNTSADRSVTGQPVGNALHVTADSTVSTTSGSTSGGTANLNFSNNSIVADPGTTLTFVNAATTPSGNGIFAPRFSGGPFTYAGRIAVMNGSLGSTALNFFNTAGNDQTYNDVISGTGSLKRSATTAGTGGIIYVNAANTYSGGTTLVDGAIGLGSDSDGAPPDVPITQGPLGTGTLTVSPSASCHPMLFTPNGGGEFYNDITLANNSAPLVVSNADTLTFKGAITGPGILSKIGPGELRLSPRRDSLAGFVYNSYSGGTIISNGWIACDSSSSGSADAPSRGPLGTGPVTFVNGGGIAALSNSRTIGNHLVFSSSAALLTGGRDLILTGNADLSGNTVTLTVNNSAATTLSGTVSNGGLTKDGPSTLTLTGVNTYAGGTTVSNGTLDVQKDGGLGSGNVAVASGATLRLSAGAANTYINSAATLTLNGVSPLVKLDFTGTPNQIGALYFGATQQANGTWGAIGSGASHQSAFFTGTGMLLVGPAIAPVTTFTISQGPGSDLTLTYSGGTGSQFVLLQTNNVAAPLSLWTRVQTNTSASGTFTITPGADPQEFYSVKSE